MSAIPGIVSPKDIFASAGGGMAVSGSGAAAFGGRGIRGADSVEKTARDFETVFLGQMLQPMFESLHGDEEFGNPFGDDVYRDWLVQEYAKKMSDAGGIGIADHVKKELLKLQEVSAGQETQAKL